MSGKHFGIGVKRVPKSGGARKALWYMLGKHIGRYCRKQGVPGRCLN